MQSGLGMIRKNDTMRKEYYVDSYDYESYIRLARALEEGEGWGADYQYMLNLIRKEHDEESVQHLSHGPLLKAVKKYMTAATQFALTRPLAADDKLVLETLVQKIEAAASSAALLDICSKGIDVLLKYRDEELAE